MSSQNNSLNQGPVVYELSAHARRRMGSRGIREGAVQTVLHYGRCLYRRGAEIYVIGTKEIARYLEDGIDLARFNGVHVICTDSGMVMTVYRNHKIQGRKPRQPFVPVVVPPGNLLPFRRPRRHYDPFHFPQGA